MSTRRASVQLWSVLVIAALANIPAMAEENVYKKAVKSTVWVVQESGRQGNRINYHMGSGAVIDVQKRLVLTNHHVVRDSKDASIFFPLVDKKGNTVQDRDEYMALLRNGSGIPGKVLFTEPQKDLAIIQLAALPKGVVPIRLAKDGPGPGDHVHSIGSPGVSAGLFNYTDGSVKAVAPKKYRTGAGPNDPNSFVIDARIIETSSSTNKGDSGGPLLNDKSELVGVTQGIMVGGDDTRPISYFIDVSEVKAVLKAHKITLSNAASATTASSEASESKSASKSSPSAAAPATSPAPSKKKLEQEAAAKLSGARLFLTSNKKQARELLHEIVEKYPGTDAAGDAQKLLDGLK